MEKKIGEITHYFAHIPAGIIKLSGVLKKGATIHIKGATTDVTQEVSSIQIDHKDIESGKKGNEVGLEVKDRVREGDEVFLVK